MLYFGRNPFNPVFQKRTVPLNKHAMAMLYKGHRNNICVVINKDHKRIVTD